MNLRLSLYIVGVALLTLFQKVVFGQNDTIPLAEIEIKSAANPMLFKQVSRSIQVITAKDIEVAPIFSLDEALRYCGGLDVRERGTLGVQSDVSIRGGGMDQNLIMVNGIAVNDPQTGHHNLNQAVMLSNIEKIEILNGPGSRWFGPNAFSGGINIITRQPLNTQLSLDVSGGQHGLFFADVSGSFSIGKWVNTTSFGHHQSDGYMRNTDFLMNQVNNESTLKLKDGLLRIYLGYLVKGFGANSFYTAKYPDQYEQIKSSLASVSFEKGTKLPVRITASWRRLYDRFELFREDKLWYQKQGDVYINGSDTAGYPTAGGIYPYKGHNYHRTDVVSMNAGLGFKTVAGSTNLGITASYEAIISNVLGDMMLDTIYAPSGDAWYNHAKNRENITFYLNQNYINGRFSFAGGLAIFYNSDYGLHFSPGVDVGYFVVDNLKVYGSVNQSIRMPTFTDLYYQGPDQVSNPDLKPESATTYELGAKLFLNQFTVTGAVFHRDGKNLIDWVKENPEMKWHSMNLTSLKTNGISCSMQYATKEVNSAFVQSVGLNYTFLKSNKSSGQYLSLYALDYLDHNLTFNLTHRVFVKNLRFSWMFNFQQRNGSYVDFASGEVVRYQPVHRVNLRINYQIKQLDLSLTCRNLLNEKTVDYGNVPQPGLWIIAGLRTNIEFPSSK
ncbi:MAG: TonB-dependent receptor [Bacteroidales bacterium]|jgi:iron complex outermembrane receptor protein